MRSSTRKKTLTWKTWPIYCPCPVYLLFFEEEIQTKPNKIIRNYKTRTLAVLEVSEKSDEANGQMNLEASVMPETERISVQINVDVNL